MLKKDTPCLCEPEVLNAKQKPPALPNKTIIMSINRQRKGEKFPAEMGRELQQEVED